MTKIYYGSNLYKKYAARIAFYNINKQIPTSQTPIVYDIPGQRVIYAPNAGFAKHYQIFDWMDDKGWDAPPPSEQMHGYYFPDQAGRFEWYGTPYQRPNLNLEEAIRSGIVKSTPQPKPVPMPRLCSFKWATAGGDPNPDDQNSQRPVIYWVNQDTVYLGRPNGAHYQIYEELEDDGFDKTAEGEQEEVHGYFNYRGTHDLYWYEAGAYGYEVNRQPIGDEEIRIKATIFNALNIPWTAAAAKTGSMLPLEIIDSSDNHLGGVAWALGDDDGVLYVTSRQGYHNEIDEAYPFTEYGRFLPQTGQVLFYDQESGGYGSGKRKDWTKLHDDIIQTLRAHAGEILSGHSNWTGFGQSAIAGQGWDNPNYAWFRTVD